MVDFKQMALQKRTERLDKLIARAMTAHPDNPVHVILRCAILLLEIAPVKCNELMELAKTHLEKE